ncbi:protein GRINL1A [Hypanus sabinus]|uniref:protein GRINL1A n=1 Tax=Hypanus sabinus TaxID=79690 RepID=UPI0028C3FE8C|nr:protein GRINL1A [Hypanus sabinus]
MWGRPLGRGRGELGGMSKGELEELLRRQLKLKANKKFIQNLPDKGKRINEFIQKLETAIAYHEEVEQMAEALSAVKLEFQMKQDVAEIFANESVTSTQTAGQVVSNKSVQKDTSALSKIDVKGGVKKEISEVCIENQEPSPERATALEREQAICHTAKAAVKNENSLDNQNTKQEVNKHTDLQIATNVIGTDFDKTADLISDKFGAIFLMENEHSKVQKKIPEEPTIADNMKLNDNPFWTLHHQMKKTPHYIDVLQQRAINPVVKKAQFKTNCPLSGSPGSSPDQSPGRSELKLSPAERRLRNQKHLDDITAARLPPLYHSPAQLLSVEESAKLQMAQKEKYESAQAKFAAERLTQRANIKVVTFDLEHEATPIHQGYRDPGDSSSSEDDLT